MFVRSIENFSQSRLKIRACTIRPGCRFRIRCAQRPFKPKRTALRTWREFWHAPVRPSDTRLAQTETRGQFAFFQPPCQRLEITFGARAELPRIIYRQPCALRTRITGACLPGRTQCPFIVCRDPFSQTSFAPDFKCRNDASNVARIRIKPARTDQA